jgi:hypothetical protein
MTLGAVGTDEVGNELSMGLADMNRLNLIHTGARAELPASISDANAYDKPIRANLIAPLTSFYLAIAGFMGCGAALIVTASVIALHIQ